MNGDKFTYKAMEYVSCTIIVLLALCALHVVAHILAWISMWKYAWYLIVIQLGLVGVLIVLSKDAYMRIEYFIGITALFAWLYMNSVHATQWDYYKLVWGIFTVIALRVAGGIRLPK